ncbi:hypothetical protein APB76_14370 [Vibrio bivalvicida]|uniref:Uncharacterized protein n=1 Tax=Vibrio bivalvicida TaxID=1276888 RepID=A0A177XX31_9VIBR|nr:hypothetical protein APB76_14370 [Vibrio bivalvicida]
MDQDIDIIKLNTFLQIKYRFNPNELSLIEHDGFLYWSGSIGSKFKMRCTFLSVKEKGYEYFESDLDWKIKQNKIHSFVV